MDMPKAYIPEIHVCIPGIHSGIRSVVPISIICSELGGDSEVSSQSSVIASGLRPSIFVDVLMAQLVRGLTGWARRLVSCLGSPVLSQAGSLHIHRYVKIAVPNC